jgi:hypothetical protein
LRKVIPIDVFFFTTADPATLLFTRAVIDEILERATPQFIENEFLHDDVNKFSWLARNAMPVEALLQACGGYSRHLFAQTALARRSRRGQTGSC